MIEHTATSRLGNLDILVQNLSTSSIDRLNDLMITYTDNKTITNKLLNTQRILNECNEPVSIEMSILHELVMIFKDSEVSNGR